MPNHVSLHIEINNIWGLIGALSLVETHNPAIIQPFNPLGWAVDSITQGNVKLGYLPIRGSLELVFIVFNVVMQAFNLLLKVVHFDGGLGFTSGNGDEEAISDGLEDV